MESKFFLQMRTHFGLPFLFICSVCTALALDREFGYPLFRTFTAYDYGEVGQIFAVTEEPYGRVLFRCQTPFGIRQQSLANDSRTGNGIDRTELGASLARAVVCGERQGPANA
jgi:hypothetical protein